MKRFCRKYLTMEDVVCLLYSRADERFILIPNFNASKVRPDEGCRSIRPSALTFWGVSILFPSVSIHNSDFSQVHLGVWQTPSTNCIGYSVLFDNRTNGSGCDHLTEQCLRRAICFATFHRLTDILRQQFSVAGTVGKNSDAKRARSEHA